MSTQPDSRVTRFAEPGTGDRLAFHLLRIAGLTLACMILAGVGVMSAAADHPNPWHVVQIAMAAASGEAEPFVAAFLAAFGGLGAAIILVILVLWSLRARVERGRGAETEQTTGRERTWRRWRDGGWWP